ncbi:DUF4879 domain-containing protein [Luteibacter aegosomatissinici]|uniref:DUF4879 domain-containing protein n=1 Tax=Luteibacter aegosomatissinici TaxID=2911539 RepID=UPI001FFB08BB|nr:DUF4879 domain-containing protein [Luteibacter aegosomatissinici]UPG93703.1 YolA family protein [Luteibacter aegosomatissinici]
MKATYLTLLAAAVAFPVHANSLSRAYVHSVKSATGGNEVVNGQSVTNRDHGGAWMHVLTDEIGYGQHAQASLLSNALREIAKEPICRAGSGVGPCRRGDTIAGYRRTWDASGHQGGNFLYVIYPAGSGSTQRTVLQVR